MGKTSGTIKCKAKRTQVYHREKVEKKKSKKKAREDRKKESELLGADVSVLFFSSFFLCLHHSAHSLLKTGTKKAKAQDS